MLLSSNSSSQTYCRSSWECKGSISVSGSISAIESVLAAVDILDISYTLGSAVDIVDIY
jgi:hypothetical protein